MPANIPHMNYRALIYGCTVGVLLLWEQLAFYAIYSDIVPLGWHWAFNITGTWTILLISARLIFKSTNWRLLFFISGLTGFLAYVIGTILRFLMYENDYELSPLYHHFLFAFIYISIAESCLAIYKKGLN